jgi:predicted RNA-binding Zn-ribbon protein involved in translation (DUF1610 family)
MGRTIEIEQHLVIKFRCDYCGKEIENNKKPVFQCCACGREICKACKRHVHVEIGSGNGKQAFKWALNHTKNYCPACSVDKIKEAYALLGLAYPEDIK